MNKFTPKPTLLPIAFFDRDTETIARELLGKILVRRLITESETGKKEVFLTGRIVETEAYVGPDDLASHASRGKTPRNAPMFGPPGHWYVYLVYGMHHCVNIVTGAEGFPAAVLLRAVIPMEGIAVMRQFREKSTKRNETGEEKIFPLHQKYQRHPSKRRTEKQDDFKITHLTDGPGKLCQAFAIYRTLNDVDATTENTTLFLADNGFDIPATSILALPRVGVDSAKEWRDRPLQFMVKDF